MRTTVLLVFIFLFTITWSQEKADSLKRKLKASASVSINSNGIASIPAFSLNKPAVMAGISLVKNRFSYDPYLAYGLDMKPWFIDNWLHYKIINRRSLELRTGVNFSSFFSTLEVEGETILKAERYFAYALEAMYRFSPNTSLTLMYWSDNGQEPHTISGHYLNLSGDISNIPIGDFLMAGINLQLFYIDYTGENDGLFISPKISAAIRNIPFSLFFQSTQPLISNISPWPGFRWNIGLAYYL